MKTDHVTPPLSLSPRGAVTRRSFLQRAAVLTLAARSFPEIASAAIGVRGGTLPPGEKINVALIGCGPQGRGVMSGFLNQKDCQVVAVCDVKADQLEIGRAAVNKRYGNEDCKTYHDFREVTARKDIDACIIATPDHWHVLVALAAVRAGKDIYLEKPLAISLEEGQVLRKVVRRHKRVFQFGTQQRSGRMFWQACTLVRNGHVGSLRHINVWASGSAPGGSMKRTPPPPGLDYDFWLGPAPEVPYTENRCSDNGALKTWWFISDYTLGFISGWGVHPLDIALWGGGSMGRRFEVEGRGTFRNTEGICDTATVWEVDYRFSGGVTMKFIGLPNGQNQGKPTGDPWLYEQEWRAKYRRIDSHGTAFEGTNGWVHVDRTGVNLQPEELIDLDPSHMPTSLVHSPGHARNFLDCVRSRSDPVSNIDAAVAADILCHTADAATRLGRRLTFDLDAEEYVNDAAANARLRCRPMRRPWRL